MAQFALWLVAVVLACGTTGSGPTRFEMDRRRCSSLIALIAAALAWFVGRGLVSGEHGLPTRDILYATWAAPFHSRTSLSNRYRLSGKAGLPGSGQRRASLPVELSPVGLLRPAAPMNGHLFPIGGLLSARRRRLPCLSPLWLVQYEDRTSVSSTLRRYVQACLRFLDEIRTAKRCGECYINHNQLASAGLAGSVSHCGESLIERPTHQQRLDLQTPRSVCSFRSIIRETVTPIPSSACAVFLLFVWADHGDREAADPWLAC